MNRVLTLVLAKAALGAGLALGFVTMPHALAHEPGWHDAYAAEVGDDNSDGVVSEDESGWSCIDDGNRVCGPGNGQGVPAGRYDEGGVLVDPWPVN